MKNKRLILGYCPTRRDVFSREDAIACAAAVREHLDRYDIDVVDLGGVNGEALLFRDADLPAVIRRFREGDVDALFFPHVNFGSENLVAQTARALGVPVLLWGPRDDSPDEYGHRSRDSQCGLFATGKALRRHNVPFTYLTNSRLGGDEFHAGLERFLRVVAVVKAMKGLRILQIAPRPELFGSVICNESELLERFDIHLYPMPLTELLAAVDAVSAARPPELEEAAAFVCSIAGEAYPDGVLKTAALKLAMRRKAEQYGCRAVAIQCWTALQDTLGVMPCLANAMLTDEGLPVVCETDIHGAVTAVMVQAAGGGVPFFADVTVRHPTDDNAELLWHCGNFPYSLCRDRGRARAGVNFYSKDRNFGIGEWELKPGQLTIVRFDGDHGEYRLLIGEAETTEGPRNTGGYVWIRTGDWSAWERRLVEGPYIHHVSAAYGHFGEILLEACKYVPGLSPDPIEPCADALAARWP